MNQKQIKETGKVKDTLSSLRRDFQQEVAQEIHHPETREVKLYYRQNCGCGGDNDITKVWFKRNVAWGSDVKDGTEATDLLETDKLV